MDIKNDNISKAIHLQLVSNVYKKTLFDLIVKNRTRLEAFFPWIRSIKNEEDVERILQKLEQRAIYGEEFVYFIWENENIVGLMGLHFVKDILQNTQIAYWLDADAEGKGIVSTALKLIIFYFFEHYPQRKELEIRCTPENERSKRVALRSGFRFVKRTFSMFEDFPDEYIKNDVYLLDEATFLENMLALKRAI